MMCYAPIMGITDELRAALKADGRTLEEIARAAGTFPANLSRFATGKKTLVLETAEKLADVLGVKLSTTKPGRPKKKGKG